MSNLFMEIGRFAPRFQSMAALYPRSKHLQDHLCEYFIEVVRLCHEILRHSKRSAIGQITSSLSDSGLNSYKSKLASWAVMIRDDVNGLMAKSVEDEREENSRFRAGLLRLSNNATSLKRQQQKIRILEVCSTYDHQTAWKQARKCGTTSSRDKPEYQAWISSPTSRTLVYTGMLGSGKTVLMANIVDDLSLHIGDLNVPVAYFFCRHDIHESLKPRTIIGSLARQILAEIKLEIDPGRTIGAEAVTSIEGVMSLLQANLAGCSKAYCVVDGLDECSAEDRREVMRILKDLQTDTEVLVCFSLRSDPGVLLELHQSPNRDANIVAIPADNPEIGEFIEAELERCLDTGKLNLGDPAMIIDIVDALTQGSQGMFLWAALQIEVLCTMCTDDAIRETLANLPEGLSETYSRIRQTQKGQHGEYQQNLLELVYAAYRPLTSEELREALSVTPKDTAFNHAKIINSINPILKCCGSLITVDEEERTVRFTHHSVKQFLEEDAIISENETFADQANRSMGSIVVTYLSYGVFGTQLSTVSGSRIDVKSTPSMIIDSTISSALPKRVLAKTFLRSRKSPAVNVERIIEEHLGRSQLVSDFQFRVYAMAHWSWHVTGLFNDDDYLRMLHKLIIGSVVDINELSIHNFRLRPGRMDFPKILIGLLHKMEAYDIYPVGEHWLMWASKLGDNGTARLLMETGKVDVDWSKPSKHTPLLLASQRGHETIVKMLLETGKVDVDRKDLCNKTPLMWASRHGYEGIVRLLLETGKVDVDARDVTTWTPLTYAFQCGHEGVVKLLLETDKVEGYY